MRKTIWSKIDKDIYFLDKKYNNNKNPYLE